MDNAIQKLLNERYFLEGETEWQDLAKRISAIYPPSLFDITTKKFVPSSPTLMNANTNGKRKGTLSSCFTMGIEDSIDGIYESLKEGAKVTKASGGVGYVFSRLRSSNENICSLNRVSSGPIPFMENFNTMLDGIQQGGVRRGAGMGQFDINHPDILNVIRLKSKKGVMERLNLSIRVTDEFYALLKENPNAPHMVYPKKGEPFQLMDDGKFITTKMLWDEIVKYAHFCAEPGIFNVDIATRQCTVTNIGEYVLSNPCAEYVSIPYSSCNLGSLNLGKFVINGEFDWDSFNKSTRIATRYLNNVIDINDYPIPKIKEVTQQVRPIGLGAMGYAHMLYLLKIPFNSQIANDLAAKIFNQLTLISMDESIEIAKETGKSYPAYDKDLFIAANTRFFAADTQQTCNILDKLNKYGIANSCFTSIAPNGSIGYIVNTTGGIEPVFALTYSRKIEKRNKEYEVVYISDPIFQKYLNDNYDHITRDKILKQVANDKGSCQNVELIPEEYRKIFVVASDISPMDHLESLGVVAKNTSLSVSKTINLHSSATREEISEVYLKAHEMGVIGVTVYRDGCRDGILVHNIDQKNDDIIVKTNAPKRPKSLPCHVYRMNILNRHNNKGEKWIVFIGLLNDDPYEIIAGKINDNDFDTTITEGNLVKSKKNGKTVYGFYKDGKVLCDDICSAYVNDLREYVTRLMSLALRHGASIEYLQKVLRKANGSIVDFDTAIIRAINKYGKQVTQKEKCPTCNSELIYSESCVKCSNPECGFTKCG